MQHKKKERKKIDRGQFNLQMEGTTYFLDRMPDSSVKRIVEFLATFHVWISSPEHAFVCGHVFQNLQA
jgi:hypothetical protein